MQCPFKIGEIITYTGHQGKSYNACKIGSLAEVRDPSEFPSASLYVDNKEWVWVKWLDDPKSPIRNGQQDGAYEYKNFERRANMSNGPNLRVFKEGKIPIKPPYPELRGSLSGLKYPVIMDPKADGEFIFICISDTYEFCVNKYGTTYEFFPALNNIKPHLNMMKHKSATFLAELCVGKGRAHQLYTLNSSKNENHAKDLQLFIFDVLEIDGADLRNEELISRKELLGTIFTMGHNYCPKVEIGNNEKDVEEFFKFCVGEGFEGIVLKPLTGKLVLDSCEWVKVKYKDQTNYTVIYVDNTQERIEIAAHIPVNNPAHPGTIAVGVKAPNKYKKHIKLGDVVTIEHQGVLESGSLRHPVLIPKPEWK